jgi:hypothetical protein
MNIQSDELLWANFDFAVSVFRPPVRNMQTLKSALRKYLQRFRIYIDGEVTPSNDFPFGFFCEGDIVPWVREFVAFVLTLGALM